MHAFDYDHARTHAARSAELAAEAAAHRLAEQAVGPAAPLRQRLAEALISAGVRLLEPAHVHTRVHRHAM